MAFSKKQAQADRDSLAARHLHPYTSPGLPQGDERRLKHELSGAMADVPETGWNPTSNPSLKRRNQPVALLVPFTDPLFLFRL